MNDTQFDVSNESLNEGRNIHLLDDLVFDLAKIANEHFLIAQDKLTKDLRSQIHHAILRGYPSFRYLQKLQASNFNVFSSNVSKKDFILPVVLWKKALNKEFM